MEWDMRKGRVRERKCEDRETGGKEGGKCEEREEGKEGGRREKGGVEERTGRWEGGVGRGKKKCR